MIETRKRVMTDDHWSHLVESYDGMKSYYILKFILQFNFSRFIHEAPLLALSGTKYDTKPPPKVRITLQSMVCPREGPSGKLVRFDSKVEM